ncbi:conserved membrane protein of unknown function [Georgfuchsia toluolica]|uniref:Uncharacterized protein n=1 Tax=Georgfuchsia toluolica TaxID=424218 RepID=A0A916N8M8_9PROT|nr:hypothetical protein [Georgfuchsia toluolica]CAG4883452.1 conserved membrane protein of unknown function [Georgfuchsia toluolica]
MSEARETRAMSAAPGIPGSLWFGLAVSYLAASASGYRGIALGVVGLMIGAVVAVSGRRIAGLFAGLILSSACFYWSDSLFIMVYLPPIAGFAFMAYFFRRTLRRGSEPLITRVARKEHPDLPLEIARYTRILTWAWSWCFLFLLVAALLLAPVLSLASWSRWVQGLGFFVPATLFLGEYIYRHHRLRDHRHGSLLILIFNIIAVIKEIATSPTPASPASIERH